jgi:hypothetical protein
MLTIVPSLASVLESLWKDEIWGGKEEDQLWKEVLPLSCTMFNLHSWLPKLWGTE